MKSNKSFRDAAILGVILVAGNCQAIAQHLDVIRMVSTEYVPKPLIIFAVAALPAASEAAPISGEKTAAALALPSKGESRSGGQAAELPAWHIELKDIYLANTFQRWAGAANWRVRWDAKKNVLIEAPDVITGSFEDAVRRVLEAPGIANSSYPLEVCFYPNTPPLARITRKGDQDKDCQ